MTMMQVSKRCPNYPPDLDGGLEKANCQIIIQ